MRSQRLSGHDAPSERPARQRPDDGRTWNIAPLSAAEYPRARRVRDEAAETLRRFQASRDVVGLDDLEHLCGALTTAVIDYETRVPGGRFQRLRLAWNRLRHRRLDDVLRHYGIEMGLYAIDDEGASRPAAVRWGRPR